MSGPLRIVAVGVLAVVVLGAIAFGGVRVFGDGAGGSGSGGAPPIGSDEPLETRIDVDTPALRATKERLGIADCPRTDGGGPGSELPPIALACLGGGPDVTMAEVQGPAVVNLWASWCGPCRTELPLLARLDREAPEELTVLGVDYQDPDPAGALGLLGRAEVTYPQLADPGGTLADQLRIIGMPGTIYVDAQGNATWLNRAFDSYDELTRLVAENTGVEVAGGP